MFVEQDERLKEGLAKHLADSFKSRATSSTPPKMLPS